MVCAVHFDFDAREIIAPAAMPLNEIYTHTIVRFDNPWLMDDTVPMSYLREDPNDPESKIEYFLQDGWTIRRS